MNLIAADERLRSMPLWEGQEPVPDPTKSPAPTASIRAGTAATRSGSGCGRARPCSPPCIRWSPTTSTRSSSSCSPTSPATTSSGSCRAPRWRDYYLAHDQTPHYEGPATGLKILQWYKPRERWVLKCPQHLEQIGPLMKTFPDATVVVTHRDPVSVIQSAATMLAYGARMNYRTTDPEWYLEYWHDRVRRLLEASVRDRHLLPSDRTVDVLFHEFMKDDMATVERIYDVAGIELTDDGPRRDRGRPARAPPGRKAGSATTVRGDLCHHPEEGAVPFRGVLEHSRIVRIEVHGASRTGRPLIDRTLAASC